jgi:hypothetical protein
VSYVRTSGLGSRLVLESTWGETGSRAAEAAIRAQEEDSSAYAEEDVTATAMTVGGAVLVGTIIIGGVLLLRKVS